MRTKNITPKLFGEALRKARLAKRVSQYMLAKRIGQQTSRITKIESGKSDLRLSSVLELADALGVTPGELLDEMAAAYRRLKAEATSESEV